MKGINKINAVEFFSRIDRDKTWGNSLIVGTVIRQGSVNQKTVDALNGLPSKAVAEERVN